MASNKRLAATIVIGGAVAGSFKASTKSVDDAFKGIGKSLDALAKRQKLLNTLVGDLGRAGRDVEGVARSYRQVTAQIDAARRAQERLNAAQKFQATAAKVGGAVSRAGTRAAAGGALIIGGAVTLTRAGVTRENAENLVRNSGATKEEQDEMLASAKRLKQFGVSTTEAIKAVVELRAATGSAQSALELLPVMGRLMSASQVYNRAHPDNQIDAAGAAGMIAKLVDERGGANDPKRAAAIANEAWKTVTSTGGKISPEMLFTAARRARLAGVAQSDESLFGDSFLMQALTPDGYGTSLAKTNSALLGGNQTLKSLTRLMNDGLIDPSKVLVNQKTGIIKRYSPDALRGHELFSSDHQSWVEKYLIPAMQKAGVNLDSAAAVNAYVSERFSADSVRNEIGQRVINRHAIDRDRQNWHTAPGIVETDRLNQQSTGGKEENARARLEDAEARAGKALTPIAADAMDKFAGAMERFGAWADAHPDTLNSYVENTVKFGAALLVASPVLKAVGAGLQVWATFRTAAAAAAVTALAASIDKLTASAAEGAVATAAEGALGGGAGGVGKTIGRVAAVVGVARAAAPIAAAAALPLVNSDEETDELKNGDARWKAIRAKHSQAEIDAARKENQPWYQVGSGYAAENEQWLAAYEKKHGAQPAPQPLPQVIDNSQNTFHINLDLGAQPVDPKEHATAIMREIQQQQAARSRARFFDGEHR
ncbi:hypothetical protein AB4Y36_10340 [Paraburkholderia sp. BR10936]|uniref:hypothetical protein n=1 Tax=Paraburkholderia sp. BR10936 TaxID=3236993 RepID=UPI0034D1C4D7